MKHLKKFLIRLQTFELRVLKKKVYKQRFGPAEEIPVYDIGHETKYYDAFTFESELRLLCEQATLDLLPLPLDRLRLVAELIGSVEKRFKQFWVNYHYHYEGYKMSYSKGYIFQINLNKLFLVRNLKPDSSENLVVEQFVEDLADSVKLRETFLQQLNKAIGIMIPIEKELTPPDTTFWPQVAPTPVQSYPRFLEGIAWSFYEVLKSYFTPEDQEQLLSLLQENTLPSSPLVFHGNGNQLADAFKQLYEANLIVGCLKADLEEWISKHFAYVLRKQQKTLTPNYLAAIISSNAKPCQSPILDVRKQRDGTYAIFPILRTQKNYSY
ncbi:hypothetical protein [Pontibacter chinhatensis]|uniref:Uncharacterized protein n=1 Tax=Pontibacter chinhatensis TaxID=1436961 RepID=A0A1I2QH22_9BACT|nr:hypothetical protein [Pontibacter chinhatensis]SFG27598.1 hypothetical protein SAMN05421739_1026 [Pontibacter chinhatensis]